MFQIIFGKNLAEKLKAIDEEKEYLLKTISSLRSEEIKLKSQIEELKSKKKIEEEDIKHMIKMREEMFSIEKQKFEARVEKEKDSEIAKVKDAHRDKLEKFLVDKNKEADARFAEILARLPNINMEINKKVGK